MAKYEVIKSHDGLAVGTIKEMSAASPIADYMTRNGYWRKVEDANASQKKSDAAQSAQPAAASASSVKKNLFKRKKK